MTPDLPAGCADPWSLIGAALGTSEAALMAVLTVDEVGRGSTTLAQAAAHWRAQVERTAQAAAVLIGALTQAGVGAQAAAASVGLDPGVVAALLAVRPPGPRGRADVDPHRAIQAAEAGAWAIIEHARTCGWVPEMRVLRAALVDLAITLRTQDNPGPVDLGVWAVSANPAEQVVAARLRPDLVPDAPRVAGALGVALDPGVPRGQTRGELHHLGAQGPPGHGPGRDLASLTRARDGADPVRSRVWLDAAQVAALAAPAPRDPSRPSGAPPGLDPQVLDRLEGRYTPPTAHPGSGRGRAQVRADGEDLAPVDPGRFEVPGVRDLLRGQLHQGPRPGGGLAGPG